MRSDSSGRVVAKTCKSWLCPTCNTWLREGARGFLMEGARWTMQPDALTLLTLTDQPTPQLDLPALALRMKVTVRAFRREGLMSEYGGGLEFQNRGALHPHLLVRTPGDVACKLRSQGQRKRDRSQYRFHFGHLVPMVRELGWGRVCDWQAIGDEDGATSYVAKSLARYATKQAYRRFKDAGAHRIRPIRSSTGWVPGKTMRDFQHGEGCDRGPWRDVTQLCARLP